MDKRYIVGVDIGGTFTDLILFDKVSNKLKTFKILTDPIQPEKSFIGAIDRLGIDYREIALIIHGTTLAANMLIGQAKLEKPKALLITNKGFTDVIEIGRQNRAELYNIYFQRPKPLIPRDMRIGIKGRINSRGEVIEDLDIDEVKQVIKNHLDTVETVIISMLNSYINPIHEKRIGEIISITKPHIYITLGSEVDPRPGEYERTVSAVVNGILKPLISRYLTRIKEDLEMRGYSKGFIVMASHGGVIGLNEAVRVPSYIIESGPAAGAIAASSLAKLMNIDNVISLDMGGTTSKASAILYGQPYKTVEYEVGGKIHMGRHVKGSGYPIRIPHTDIAEIGVGGGSLIWLDEGGQLRIGPKSAGADPGPACYGRGGVEPTLTDAYLILGWLPESLGGGEIRLSLDAAYKAFEDICRGLGIDPYEVSHRAVEIANEHLHRCISIVSIERGYDIEGFTIILFGGAAPIHTTFLIELGFRKAVIPPYAGIFSAYGLIETDYRYMIQRSIGRYAREDIDRHLNMIFHEMENESIELLTRDEINIDTIFVRRYLEMRYWRQGRNILIEFNGSIKESIERFIDIYRGMYGYTMDEKPYIDTAILEVEAENRLGIEFKSMDTSIYSPEADSTREAYIDGRFIDTPLYNWGDLNPGAEIYGPAIIHSNHSTIVIRPSYRLYMNDYRVFEVTKI